MFGFRRQTSVHARQMMQSGAEGDVLPFAPRPDMPPPANQDTHTLTRAQRRWRFVRVSVKNFIKLRRRLVTVMTAFVCVTLTGALTLYVLGGVGAAKQKSQAFINDASAVVGLSIAEIEISVPPFTKRATLIEALKLSENESILTFDVHQARDRLLALPSIQEAEISKLFPSGLRINVTEFTPVARWQLDKVHYVISPEGKPMGLARPADIQLPLLVGKGAGDIAAQITVPMGLFPQLHEGLVAFSRIAERRWDLLYAHGLRVRLPAQDVPLALERLARLEAQQNILQRDLALIDLRQKEKLVVRPTDRALEKMKLSETISP